MLWRLADTVRLQARSGRDVTTPWMGLAVAGMALPPGVVLDGEAVVVVEGRVSFEAAQSRAASSPAGARAKHGSTPYRAGRSSSWKKVRHAETVDAEVVGWTGSAVRPRALAVRLPDGRVALSQRLGRR